MHTITERPRAQQSRGSDPKLPHGKAHCLCRSCGTYFLTLKAFERHQLGDVGNRVCARDAQLSDVGLVYDGSHWRLPVRSFDIERRQALDAARRADRALEVAA